MDSVDERPQAGVLQFVDAKKFVLRFCWSKLSPWGRTPTGARANSLLAHKRNKKLKIFI